MESFVYVVSKHTLIIILQFLQFIKLNLICAWTTHKQIIQFCVSFSWDIWGVLLICSIDIIDSTILYKQKTIIFIFCKNGYSNWIHFIFGY